MALLRLPDDTPICLIAPTSASWSHGKLTVLDQGFPAVAVQGTWGDPRPSDHSSPLLYPVLLQADGLYVDPAWRIFALAHSLQDRDKLGELSFFLRRLDQKETALDISCPSLSGHQSVFTHVLKACSDTRERAGWTDEDLQKGQTLLTNWVQKTPLLTLQRLEEKSGTLLDLAMRYQLWSLAEALWQKGIRWSEAALEAGEPLASLVEGTTGLRSTISSFLGYWARWDESERVQASKDWLQTWQQRWVEEGGQLPSVAKNSSRAERLVKNGMPNGATMRDTPVSLWAATMVEVAGPKAQDMGRAPAHVKELFYQWVTFWAFQGVELESLEIPRPSGLASATLSFGDYWSDKGTDWRDAALALARQVRLDATLQSGTDSLRKPRI